VKKSSSNAPYTEQSSFDDITSVPVEDEAQPRVANDQGQRGEEEEVNMVQCPICFGDFPTDKILVR